MKTNNLLLYWTGLAFILFFLISLAISWIVMRIPVFQTVSSVLPSHKHKQGTRSMGGLIWLPPVIFIISHNLEGMPPWINSAYPNPALINISIIAALILGIADDVLKAINQNNRGLAKGFKFILLAGVMVLGYLISIDYNMLNIMSLGKMVLSVGFIMAFIAAYSVTDGLDGLLGSIAIFPLFYILQVSHNPYYFWVIAAVSAFLCYNVKPAKLFMGEIGAMTLGALVAPFFLTHPIQIGAMSIVPIINLASVGLKLGLAKLGVRYKILAPLHHEIEKHIGERNTVLLLFAITGMMFFISETYLKGLTWPV